MKAVFIDRDGVINKEVDGLRNLKDLRILKGVAQGISRLHKLGFLIIVITNQAVVARGLLTEKGLADIHEVIRNRLKKNHAFIDKIYYCPHHPEANQELYKKDCIDRKPHIGLIQKAVADFSIDLKKSYLIGDRTVDIQTAKNAGVTSLLVKTGYGGKDGIFQVTPDYVANNFLDAVEFIAKRE